MSRLPVSTDTLAELPVSTLASGQRLYRVNETGYPSPVFYSTSAENRWTPVAGSPGVCYLAISKTGAIAESVCRNSAYLEEEEKIVSLNALSTKGMYEIHLTEPVQVLDLTVSNLGRYRLDATILSDYDQTRSPPYKFCPAWASHAVSLGLHGILYRSRHVIDEPCLALFEGSASLQSSLFDDLRHPELLAILEEQFGWAVT
ncbi:RES family NAD+ phosphorylase [Hydrocarboniclastica marina]|uniref:RES domain-containing protein n=1 Tax=Hydrocarboniclastica marina TaxID=2259620 RepID=A0A4P7XM66_9ALTE|nr:RES family NAD+ phosphorylase [Hydrocarboniclastica marina]QCF28095.1 RES domain-containing protein [Hydrocarboniclastica marina]